MGEITGCEVCGSPDLPVLLDMGKQPLAERDSDVYPLVLVQCAECSLVQLSYAVDQALVFPLDHPYATGNTKALREHFARLAARIEVHLSPGDLVVDIGSNDGTLLESFSDSVNRFGVEPTDQARKCAGKGIPVWQGYFTVDVARGIRASAGHAKVITACNVLAHVPDPHDFVAGVAELLTADGEFITENHDLASITEGLQIDTIYHEHLRYYSVASLSHLLTMHGLDVTSVERVPTHGGSLRVTARKRSSNLAGRAFDAATRLHELLTRLVVAKGAAVYGIGAATRATPLIHYADIAHLIGCVCEVSASEKIGMLMPGTHIPVVDEVRLVEDQPEYALLFSWHIADSLIPKLRAMGYQGKFIIPLPEPRISDR
jgi:C-methyltransferase C-terminal domain/Methyltransferase domain/Putative zinc binding domain